MTSHAMDTGIGVRIDGGQITGHARAGVGQPGPFPDWLGLAGTLDQRVGDPSSTGGSVPGSTEAMGQAGRPAGAWRGGGR